MDRTFRFSSQTISYSGTYQMWVSFLLFENPGAGSHPVSRAELNAIDAAISGTPISFTLLAADTDTVIVEAQGRVPVANVQAMMRDATDAARRQLQAGQCLPPDQADDDY